jgi:hypothetical protein
VRYTAAAYRRRAHRYGRRALLALHLAQRSETCAQQFVETTYLHPRAAARMAALALAARAPWASSVPIVLATRMQVLGPRRRTCLRLLHQTEEFDPVGEVYQRVAEELRPGVYAQWADPWERWR